MKPLLHPVKVDGHGLGGHLPWALPGQTATSNPGVRPTPSTKREGVNPPHVVGEDFALIIPAFAFQIPFARGITQLALKPVTVGIPGSHMLVGGGHQRWLQGFLESVVVRLRPDLKGLDHHSHQKLASGLKGNLELSNTPPLVR